MLTIVGCVLTLVLAACGDDDGDRHSDAEVDARADGDASRSMVASPMAVRPPAAVMAPQLVDWVCPTGWVTTPLHGDVDGCLPYAAIDDCADGEIQLPGHAACEPFEPACSAPVDADLHVRVGATGGDGSAAMPFGTIAEAVTAASAGDVIALEAGIHVGGVEIDKDVTIVGACASGTRITAPSAEAWAVDVIGHHVTLQRARIEGLRVEGSAQVDLDHVHLAVTGPSLLVDDDARVRGRHVRIGDPAIAGLVGVVVGMRGSVELDESVIESPTGIGVGTFDTATLTLHDVTLRDIRRRETGVNGNAIFADVGSTIHAQRVAIEGVDGTAIYVAGAEVELDDVLARHMIATAEGRGGYALYAGMGAHVTANRIRIEDAMQAGAFADEANTDVSFSDFAIIDVAPRPMGPFGSGVSVEHAAKLTLTRGVVAELVGAGLLVLGEGTRVEATDVIVTDLQPAPDAQLDVPISIIRASGALTRVAFPPFGSGLALEENATAEVADVSILGPASLPGHGMIARSGSTLHATRVEIEAAVFDAVSINDATADLEDLTIRDTSAEAIRGVITGGVRFINDARGSLKRVAIETPRYSGVMVLRGSDVAIEDYRCADPRGDSMVPIARGLQLADAHATLMRADITGAGDGAIACHDGASLEATDVHIDGLGAESASGVAVVASAATFERIELLDLARFGAAVWLDGSELTLTDALVRGTRAGCAELGCGTPDFGVGAAAYQGASITLDRFAIEDSATCGAGGDGSIALRHGRLSGNAAGVCVGSDAIPQGLAEDVALDDDVDARGDALPALPPIALGFELAE